MHSQLQLPSVRSGSSRGRGFTLVELVLAMSISGLLFAALSWHLIESTRLSGRVTLTLEHSRNARELIDRLNADVRAAQILRVHPSFTDRATTARDGESGNYLVLQQVDRTGAITRTIGYYAEPTPRQGGWTVYRHDSAEGHSAAAVLPGANAHGTHRVIKRAVRLPDSNEMFRSVRDRGVSIYGEFGSAETGTVHRTEFIRCTILTRS